MSEISTKDRILDAAELAFAERGFAATSLRAVTAAAGVNLAAVNYHFGSKDGLIRAVFARRLDPVNRDRLDRLDAAEREATSAGPSLEHILETFVRPVARLADATVGDTPLLAALLGRVHVEPDAGLRDLLAEQFEEAARRYLAAFARALPHLGERELRARFQFCVAAMAGTLADPHMPQRLVGGTGHDVPTTEQTLARLVPFLAGALRAPAADRTVADEPDAASTVDEQPGTVGGPPRHGDPESR